MIDLEKTFIGILVSIFLICFAAYIGWRTFTKKRKISAADKFKNVVISELSELYPEGINYFFGRDAVEILRNKHHVINTAVIEFRPFVSNKKKFDAAWENFSGIGVFRDKEEQARYNQYSFTGKNCEFYEEPRKMFIRNLEKLLAFANKT